MDNAITYLSSFEIDRNKTLLLIEASIQAYNAFNKDDSAKCNWENVTQPEDYELVDSWTGVDAVFNQLKRVECYGIVFRSQKEPYTYIFAFRGTDGIEDLCDDFGFNPVPFQAYDKNILVPSDVTVESGFYHIYADSHRHTASMQHQLFALIDKYQASPKPIDQIYVTGHSLGCTLATLFTLDLALSRPEMKVVNYNYASPRVGNQAFVNFYQQQSLQQNSATTTVRFQNVYDKVPCTPLKIQRYKHLPYAYLIAFYRDNFTGKFDIVDNHSVQNYKKVLEYILNSSDDSYETVFESDRDKKIKSVLPNPTSIGKYW
ncbi:MAG: lipase family protein [Xenococcaceae cyanobacterium MO_188.B19]|nr:lipase family protein [Xenococcaceae cyanobacterium MO_188.B19]